MAIAYLLQLPVGGGINCSSVGEEIFWKTTRKGRELNLFTIFIISDFTFRKFQNKLFFIFDYFRKRITN
ncbi:hypothetical protein KL86DYS2_12186 [uncultured Dysgonomonas sp.]|uniref:Uncharacterized protein n=1 Tax=uncultured Dysgonomonas sp. TaxID=206096 RepID=A0A212JRP3_9BACT|nr:hypothetical protein KL86DYS2_12186 [uncultured Dysgonomonas sp.]